jgi:hypothetical protein
MRTIAEDEFATAVLRIDGWIDARINREIDEGIVNPNPCGWGRI